MSGAGPTATPADSPQALTGDPSHDPAVDAATPLPDAIGAPAVPDYRSTGGDVRAWRRALRMPRVLLGGGLLGLVVLLCVGTLPWTLFLENSGLYFDETFDVASNAAPFAGTNPITGSLGYDQQRRSVLSRCLLGGVVSLSVGLASALISVVLGCGVGLVAGYSGGKVDALLMRFVDIMYGLPYILLVILFKVGLQGPIERLFTWIGVFDSPASASSLAVMFLAIGLVSWLTMARVVRGQTLSLRDQPFVEAARAGGLGQLSIFRRHLLPNLVGPILVYATLTIPQAILQESFLSFLGIGVVKPLPSWGSLANDGLQPALNAVRSYWWQLVYPCVALAVTLLSLNFLGDGLRDLFDPKRESGKL